MMIERKMQAENEGESPIFRSWIPLRFRLVRHFRLKPAIFCRRRV